MRGNLNLTDRSELFYDNVFSVNTFGEKFIINIYVDEKIKLEDQLNNKNEFDRSTRIERKIAEEIGLPDKNLNKVVKHIKTNFDKLFDNVDEIQLNFVEIDYLDFIKNNPIVLSKKLIICENMEINDYDKAIELINKYKDIMNKVYIYLDNNSEPVSLIDCYKTIKAIKEKADSVSRLGLSPMETIMYVYDQVRNRVYKYEDENEELSKSRDLTEVLFSDKIVCLGYANVMSAILSYLGIKNNIVRLIDEKNGRGHARNAIYVNDPKYDIDGLYYFDATWDSKKEENDNSYLKSYRYFAKTKAFFDEDDDYEELYLSDYSKDIYNIIENILLSKEYDKVLKYYKIINHMFNMVNKKIPVEFFRFVPASPVYGIFDEKLFLSELKDVCNKFTKEIPPETMINIFINVRKIEYYQNPEWYPFDIKNMCYVSYKSKWNINDKIIRNLLGNLTIEDDPEIGKHEIILRVEELKKFAFENEIPKQIAEVKFAKVLRNVLEKKKN